MVLLHFVAPYIYIKPPHTWIYTLLSFPELIQPHEYIHQCHLPRHPNRHQLHLRPPHPFPRRTKPVQRRPLTPPALLCQIKIHHVRRASQIPHKPQMVRPRPLFLYWKIHFVLHIHILRRPRPPCSLLLRSSPSLRRNRRPHLFQQACPASRVWPNRHSVLHTLRVLP